MVLASFSPLDSVQHPHTCTASCHILFPTSQILSCTHLYFCAAPLQQFIRQVEVPLPRGRRGEHVVFFALCTRCWSRAVTLRYGSKEMDRWRSAGTGGRRAGHLNIVDTLELYVQYFLAIANNWKCQCLCCAIILESFFFFFLASS